MMKLSLEEWLGADQAKAPREIVRMATEAAVSAAMIRVEQAKEAFEARPKKEREAALADAAGKSAFHYRNLFKLVADAEWETTCPACSGKAYLAGMQFHEEVLDDVDDGDSWEETVERHYEAEEFRCPVCTLHLYSHDEIAAVGLNTNHQEIETRERTYEADYGNDCEKRLVDDLNELTQSTETRSVSADPGGRIDIRHGLKSRLEEWTRPPEPRPPQAGYWWVVSRGDRM